MDKKVKISLIVAVVLMVAGLAMMAASVWVTGFDGLSTTVTVTSTCEITEAIRDLDIQVGTADVIIVPSEDGTCKVVCDEEEKLYHSVTVRDGILQIRKVDEREWHDNVGIHMGDSQVKVYLPQAEYGMLTVEGSTGRVEIMGGFCFDSIEVTVSTGSVRIGAVTADSIELNVTTGRVDADSVTCHGELTVRANTGDVYLTDIGCGTLISEGSAGDIVLTGVIAEEKMDIRRTTGDVELMSCDGPVIIIGTGTGDVTGSILTGKRFETHTSTGKVQVPESATGGECHITTSTGDIRISVG